MKKRGFNLQPALSYKEKLEDIRQMELAQIEAAYASERRILELLAELEKLGYQELEQQHGSGVLDMGAIGAYFSDLQALQKRTEQQALLLRNLAEQVQRKRDELIAVSKEKKALEKLKEKHKENVALALKRAENKVLEDVTTSQFHRRGMIQA